MTENFKEEAEKHWQFIEQLLRTYRGEEDAIPPEISFNVKIETCHYLYVQAMVHGYKHARTNEP